MRQIQSLVTQTVERRLDSESRTLSKQKSKNFHKPTVGVPSYGASGHQFQIDDKHNDYEEAKIKSELFRETLIKSGFIPENEKSTWEPCKIVTGLGIDVNLSSVALKITRF